MQWIYKCLSHGQSQSFIAATPLPRAMEYETAFRWRNSKGIPQQQKAHFMTFAWEYANMCCLLHNKAEGPGRPSVKRNSLNFQHKKQL